MQGGLTMATYTSAEAFSAIVSAVENETIQSFDIDNNGQLVFYTGIFKWEDGTFHDESECTCSDDENSMHPNKGCPTHGGDYPGT